MSRFSVSSWPVSRQLTAMLLLVSVLVLLLTSASFVGYQYWSFRRSARDTLVVRGQIIAANSTASLAFGDEQAAGEILAALGADPHIVAAALFDSDGRLFVAYPAEPSGMLAAVPGPDGYRFEGGFLIGYEPVAEAGGDRLGTLYLASDLDALYDTFRLSGFLGFAVVGLSLLLAIGLSGVLQRAVSEPILRLAETATAVSARRDYSVRAPQVQGQELSELTNALNHMLGRIEEQDRALRESQGQLQGYASELEARVTERTHDLEETNEALRRNAADLQASNRELDAFAYSVSHDLRAPLRSIDGFSQVLLEDYASELDDAGRDSLSRVRAASQRMGSLIDDLLKLARITRVGMTREMVDVSVLANEIVADLQRSAPERQVEVSIAQGLQANGDRRLLRVALDNLLRNSWKYTGKQPCPRIEFGSVQVDGKCTFMVRDNGAGFDMKYADKLFGEFQRLHSESEFEGTGVGLATVRRIITRHGGSIWAEAAVGQGATFYFTL